MFARFRARQNSRMGSSCSGALADSGWHAGGPAAASATARSAGSAATFRIRSRLPIGAVHLARASYMNEQSESLAGILPCTHAAIFLIDTHGEEHTDEIGMHTVLYSLQRMSRRDARQPRPPWSSLTLRRRTSDERAAGRARVSESWRLSALRCRRRGVEMWTSLRWVRAVCSCGTAAPYGPARSGCPSA